MHYLAGNLRQLRKKRSWTQAQLAEKLGLNRSLIGAYEEGRSEPKIATLPLIAHLFRLSIDDLLQPSPAASRESVYRDSLRILPVAVDQGGQERITLIPQKAAAGYTQGYADAEYIEKLQTAHLPLPELQQGGTTRIFQIEGDSMLPVKPGSYIIGEYVEDWQDVKSGECYILLTLQDGIVYKRIENRSEEDGQLLLRSDNPEYKSYHLPLEDVIELWKAKGILNFEIPDRDAQQEIQNQRLWQMMDTMRAEIRALHQKIDPPS